MDLEFKNQDHIPSDEYDYDRIAMVIKSLRLEHAAYYVLKSNFNGFINLYKDWRIKAIKQIKTEEKGNYFESFTYNWIAFNACYSFYRESSSHLEDTSVNNKNDEGENIYRLGNANIHHKKEKIMRLYLYSSFKALIDLRITDVPYDISKIISDLKTPPKLIRITQLTKSR
jgi:hypothetical protein